MRETRTQWIVRAFGAIGLCAALGPPLFLAGCRRNNDARAAATKTPVPGPPSAPQSIQMGGAKSVTRFFVTSKGLGRGGDLGGLAGEAGNWELAAYEIKELGEGFDDIVKLHPTHEESPVAPKDAIPRMVTVPLMELRAAVDKKDVKDFEQKYDTFTKACNDCHQATNFAFNVVQRPATNPYPNQVFAPARK